MSRVNTRSTAWRRVSLTFGVGSLLAIAASLGVAVNPIEARDRLPDPGKAKLAVRCQRDLLRASAAFTGAKLKALGVCANSLFSCLEKGQSTTGCNHSTEKCRKALAPLVQSAGLNCDPKNGNDDCVEKNDLSNANNITGICATNGPFVGRCTKFSQKEQVLADVLRDSKNCVGLTTDQVRDIAGLGFSLQIGADGKPVTSTVATPLPNQTPLPGRDAELRRAFIRRFVVEHSRTLGRAFLTELPRAGQLGINRLLCLDNGPFSLLDARAPCFIDNEHADFQPAALAGVPPEFQPCVIANILSGQDTVPLITTRAADQGSCALTPDPDSGPMLAKCASAILKETAKFANQVYGSIALCAGALFACEQTANDQGCDASAAAKCTGAVQRAITAERAALGAKVTKACEALDIEGLRSEDGLSLDGGGDRGGIAPQSADLTGERRKLPCECASVGVDSIDSFDDYTTCLTRAHECRIANLVSQVAPRLEDLLAAQGLTVHDLMCHPPAPPPPGTRPAIVFADFIQSPKVGTATLAKDRRVGVANRDGLCQTGRCRAGKVCKGGDNANKACFDDTQCAPQPTSNCCAPHSEIGCDQPSCQDDVCNIDPYCCEVEFDSICVGEAEEFGCCATGGSDCCTDHASPGCKVDACAACVCSFEPSLQSCCTDEWSAPCTAVAQGACDANCSCPASCVQPSLGCCNKSCGATTPDLCAVDSDCRDDFCSRLCQFGGLLCQTASDCIVGSCQQSGFSCVTNADCSGPCISGVCQSGDKSGFSCSTDADCGVRCSHGLCRFPDGTFSGYCDTKSDCPTNAEECIICGAPGGSAPNTASSNSPCNTEPEDKCTSDGVCAVSRQGCTADTDCPLNLGCPLSFEQCSSCAEPFHDASKPNRCVDGRCSDSFGVSCQADSDCDECRRGGRCAFPFFVFCTSGEQCVGGVCQAGFCALSCTSDDQCFGGVCQAGSCLFLGGRCATDGECFGYECLQQGPNSQCLRGLSDPNATCSFNSQCNSGVLDPGAPPSPTGNARFAILETKLDVNQTFFPGPDGPSSAARGPREAQSTASGNPFTNAVTIRVGRPRRPPVAALAADVNAPVDVEVIVAVRRLDGEFLDGHWRLQDTIRPLGANTADACDTETGFCKAAGSDRFTEPGILRTSPVDFPSVLKCSADADCFNVLKSITIELNKDVAACPFELAFAIRDGDKVSDYRGVVIVPPTCGDGRPDQGEECDNGGIDNGCCTSSCKYTRRCTGGANNDHSCTGASSECPGGTCPPPPVCRAASGLCDVEERCVQSSDPPTLAGFIDVSCPADAFVPPGTSCGDSGPCSGSVCDGQGSCSFEIKPVGTSCTDNATCIVGQCNEFAGCDGTFDPNACSVPSVKEDLPCNTAVADRWTFDVTAGQTVSVLADTIDAATAADLCFQVDCDDGSSAFGDDDGSCTFPPPAFACPQAMFQPVGDATCTVVVGLCSDACADPSIANYRLAVTRDGVGTTPTLVDDDGAF